MPWNMDCRVCSTSILNDKLCKKCWSCFDCVDQCSEHHCIDCYDDDPIVQMKAIWERRRKPHIELMMSTKNGHYMALESVCHSCEHAYKIITRTVFDKEVAGDVMQYALEAVLRVHDFSSAASHGDEYLASEKPCWGRSLAREVRTLLLGPLKHDGKLPEWITLTNNPNHIGVRTVHAHGTNISPEVQFDPDEWQLGMTEDGTPYWFKERTEPIQWSDPEVEVVYGAKSVTRLLSQGLDRTYTIFTDPNSPELQKSWFSPAEQGQFRGNVDKQRELIAEEIKVNWN